MICSECGSKMSAFSKKCRRCRSDEHLQPSQAPISRSEDISYGPAVSKRSKFKTRALIFSIVIMALVVLTFVHFAGFNAAVLREKANATLRVARFKLAPMPDNCGAMAPDECRWISQARDILQSSVTFSKQDGETAFSRLSRLSATIDQSKADFLQMPDAPERCITAKQLVGKALDEAQMSVTLAKQAISESALERVQTIKSANEHRQRAGVIYGASIAEFQRLFGSSRSLSDSFAK